MNISIPKLLEYFKFVDIPAAIFGIPAKYIFKRLDEESRSIKLAALEMLDLLRFLYRVKISILKVVKDNIRIDIIFFLLGYTLRKMNNEAIRGNNILILLEDA
tara:strand:+ start:347 stop:655 length:309 start_codon:yes stop_codon:yes gene_type:complete